MASSARVVGERYELRNEIGDGGASRVYRAYDRVLLVERAVKLLDTRSRSARSQMTRLGREARALARLRHPRILPLYDVNLCKAPYLVTEYCPAGSLQDRIDRGAVPPREAVELAIQISDALEFAHSRGVVHRDVKPANVLIGPDGGVLLCDFGAALDLESTRITQAGGLLGTFAYMAPEQRLDSTVVTGKTDQYALAATLYALITVDAPADLFIAAPSSPRWWGIPEALAPILQRAVRYDPSHRYPDMAQFRNALHHVLPDMPKGEMARGKRLKAVDAVVPALVGWYRKSVAERAEALRLGLGAWEREEEGAEEELRRICHMLRGSGSSFGFPMITDAAAAAEDSPAEHLPNRLHELIYVLRHVTVSETSESVAVLGMITQSTQRHTLMLVLPDAQILGTWQDAREWIRRRRVDVLICSGDRAAALEIQKLRREGIQLPIVVLADDTPRWRALGADRTLGKHPDPVRLANIVRGLGARDHVSGAILERHQFMARLTEWRSAERGAAGRLFILRWPECEPSQLVDIKRLVQRGVVLGHGGAGLFALVPEAARSFFLRILPSKTLECASVISADLDCGRTVGELITVLRDASADALPGTIQHTAAAECKKRVVVTEDDPDVSKLVCEIVQGSGHAVETYQDGIAALNAALSNPPDLLVLDIELPGLDGFAVLQELRSDPRTAKLPILILSARSTDRDVVLALELGASDHVAKPFKVSVLDARIRALLRR